MHMIACATSVQVDFNSELWIQWSHVGVPSYLTFINTFSVQAIPAICFVIDIIGDVKYERHLL